MTTAWRRELIGTVRPIGVVGMCILASVGCGRTGETPPSGEPARVEAQLASGATVWLDLGGPARELHADGRFGWELSDGTRVLLQSAVGDEEPGSVERTPESVAVALCERLELGDAEGELAHHPCRAGALDAECVVGWQVDAEGDRWTRRGAIFDAAGEIVWLDVTSSVATEALNARADRIRSSVVVEAAR